MVAAVVRQLTPLHCPAALPFPPATSPAPSSACLRRQCHTLLSHQRSVADRHSHLRRRADRRRRRRHRPRRRCACRTAAALVAGGRLRAQQRHLAGAAAVNLATGAAGKRLRQSRQLGAGVQQRRRQKGAQALARAGHPRSQAAPGQCLGGGHRRQPGHAALLRRRLRGGAGAACSAAVGGSSARLAGAALQALCRVRQHRPGQRVLAGVLGAGGQVEGGVQRPLREARVRGRAGVSTRSAGHEERRAAGPGLLACSSSSVQSTTAGRPSVSVPAGWRRGHCCGQVGVSSAPSRLCWLAQRPGTTALATHRSCPTRWCAGGPCAPALLRS